MVIRRDDVLLDMFRMYHNYVMQEVQDLHMEELDAEEFQASAEARANNGADNGFDYFGYAQQVTIDNAWELMIEVDKLTIDLSNLKGMCEEIICPQKSKSVEEMHDTFTDKALHKWIEIVRARDDRLKKLTEIQLN